ncbi:MAG: site-2 protease family protein [Gemmatimonadales bacterium]
MPLSQDRSIPVDLTPYVIAWRTTVLHDREVVDALIHPAHAGPSTALAQVLQRWDGTYYWSEEPGGHWLVLTRRRAVAAERWWLHVLLFALTLATTTLAGAVLHGSVIVDDTFGLLRGRVTVIGGVVTAITAGLAFAVPLLAMLLAHEMGHYFTARRYQLDVSPPYFIPVPLFPSFIGTMGAFIRLRTVLSDRRQLFDVGLAGPIAGFVVAVPVLLFGLVLSEPLSSREGIAGMVLLVGRDGYLLGDSLVTLGLRWLVHGGAAVALHPVAFAGTLGMFVTMINLMPMAQLDGGHILYAAQPRLHRRAALIFWLVVLGLGHWWIGWYLWAALVLLVSRGRLDHPPLLDAYRPFPTSRRWLLWVAGVLFLLTFAPVPFKT